MLRISEIGGGNGHVVLKLEGRLIGPWVDELQKASARLLDRNEKLRLDLADVSYVDREGVILLRNLKQREVVLAGCSSFILEELREAERSAQNLGRPRRASP